MDRDSTAQLGDLLQRQLGQAIKEGDPDASPLRRLLEDVKTRHTGKPKYAVLSRSLRPHMRPFYPGFPDDDNEGHARIGRWRDDARDGHAPAFIAGLISYYWSAHREFLLALLRPFDGAREIIEPILAADAAQEQRSKLHPIIEYGKYHPRDWEIALHRIAEVKKARHPHLNLSKLRIDALPESVLELEWLTYLDCSVTLVTRLPELGKLPYLKTVDCSYSRLDKLPDLRSHGRLEVLYCGVTQIGSLAEIEGCQSLWALFCGSTSVADLSPLANCGSLKELHCEDTPVRTLEGLESCKALAVLDCGDTPVSDLHALEGSPHLRNLVLNGCAIEEYGEKLWMLPSLDVVWLYRSKLAGVPDETLSRAYDDNCLLRIREHFRLKGLRR